MYASRPQSAKRPVRKLLPRQRLLGQGPSLGGGASTAQVVSGRAYMATRGIWAATLLLFPHQVLRAVGGPVDPLGVAVARVLGIRHGIQTVAENSRPRWHKAGVTLDLLHATSMLVAAAFHTRWRRAALTDFVAASTFTLWGLNQQSSSNGACALEKQQGG